MSDTEIDLETEGFGSETENIDLGREHFEQKGEVSARRKEEHLASLSQVYGPKASDVADDLALGKGAKKQYVARKRVAEADAAEQVREATLKL